MIEFPKTKLYHIACELYLKYLPAKLLLWNTWLSGI